MLEDEVTEFLGRARYDRLGADEDRYRNGYGKLRRLTTRAGTVTIRRPRVRGLEQRFESNLLPLFRRRTREVSDLLPELYLHGLALGDFELALRGLFGEQAPLSPSTVARVKERWEVEAATWQQRGLAELDLVYLWVDGVYVRAGLDKDKAALLVAIGGLGDGRKVLVALRSGYRESAESWKGLLRDVRQRGLRCPRLVVGDGSLAIWAALTDVYPEADEQRCWNHRIVNVLGQVPKRTQQEAKQKLKKVAYAPTLKQAERRKGESRAGLARHCIKKPPARHTIASDRKADTRPSTMAETEQGGPPILLTRQSAKKSPDRTAHGRGRRALDRSDIQGVMRSKDPRLTIIGVFLAAAMLMLGFPAPAHAQTVLVSNTGQSNAGQTSVNPSDHAQGFTTGQNTLGYSLTSIELGVGVASGSGTLTVTVRGDDGSGDPGGNTLYTLNNPANVAAGLRTFTAPAGASLSANTQYFVQMVFAPNGSASYPRWDNTTSSLQDSGSAIGWSIRNERHVRTPGSTGWGSTNFTVLQIRVNGQIRAPAAPMNLSATPDDGQVTLSWANPANNTITKYQYRRKTDTGTYGSWTDIPNSGDTTTSYTVTGLTNGTEYTFGVRAVNAGGNGAASTVTATPAPVPAAPTNLEAEVRDRRIGLTWANPANNTITKYQYRRKTDTGTYGSWTDIPNSDDTTTSYTVTGLTNGTQYTFAVRAVNNTDDGVESTVTATPLWPAPTGLVATAGQGRVTLEWNNGHAGIGDYFTYARGSDIVDRTKFLPRRSGSTTTDIVYPLTNGILYTFSVRALHGRESPTVTARPVSMPAPDNLTATEGDDRQTTLSWSDPGDDSIYKYQVSIDNGTTFTDISDSSKSTTTTTVTGLTNGTGYTLAVRGVNWWGYGAASTATATPLWPAPTNLVATPDSSRVFLEWDRNPGITDYRVDVSDGSSVSVSAGSGSKTIAAIDSLANGTAYTFTVLATQDSAQGSADSSWPATVDATPMVVSPDAPTNLSATPSNSQATLSWDDPGNNTITKYQVSRDGGTSFTNISDSGASTTTTTVTGLTNGTLYTFAVRAENASGRGLAATTTATPVNDAPTASAKTVSTDEDTAYTFKGADFGFTSVKSGATLNHMKITALPGADKGTLSVGGTAITGVTTPRQVTKTGLDAGNLTYTPPANANGAAFATFAFKVNDGVADSDMAYTITINVNAVNDPLTGSDKTVSTDEDTAYIFKEADFAFSDVDAGATLGHVKITSLPGSNQGTLSVGDTPIASVSPPLQVTKDELGTLTYTPPTNAFGAAFATFNFKVSDGTDDSDKAYTITIDVNAVNDPPVAVTDTAETSEDIPVVIGVLENDSDVDPGTALRVVEVGFPTAPSKGTAAINPNNTTVTYTPNANVTGTDTFSYAVTDGFDTSNVEVAVEILGSGTNANLSNLTISQGTLMPDFSATTTSYAVRVEALTDSVQVTPTTADAQATVTVNGALVDSGTASDDIALTENDVTRITVAVTAADGTPTQTTTIDVTRPLSDNANLSGLTISSGTLTPVFAVGTTDYRVDVGNAVDSVTVTPATEHAGATVTVNGALVDSGSASGDIALIEGDTTTIAVVVTAADGVTTKAYAIEVRRFAEQTRLVVTYQEEIYTATEGGEAVTVTVKLSPGWDEELAIPIRVTRPETTEVADYTLDGLEEWDAQEDTGRLTFPAEETEQTFTIKANHDGDGDDETVELGFGELPEIVLAGEPGVATVTLEDKGLLVELTVSFGQAEYDVKEGQQADIEVTVSPAADRRVEVPLVVVLQGGATDEDYSGVPVLLAFEEGESQGAISLAVLADEVNDPGEGIGLSFGELPQAVIAGDPASTQVLFIQRRTVEQFSQTLEVSLAVLARSTAASAQSAIQDRFERHRQWSRMASSGATQGTGAREAAGAGAAEPTQGSWLRSFSELTDFSGMRDQEFSLAGTSFEIPLAKQEQGRSTSWVPVLWGQGNLQHFNGDLNRIGMNYRGLLAAAHVGLDLYAHDKMLAGLSFMRSWGDLDYTDDGVDGVLESDLNTFLPYLYWQPNERMSVWGLGGIGWGKVDVKEPGRTHHFDADLLMLAGGVRSVLCRWPCDALALRADVFTAQLETDATDDIAKVSGEAHGARLMLEWVHDRPLSAGRSLSLRMEAGGRWDGGDADRGAGVETGFRLGYLDANHGPDVALHGRTLVVHESDYRDWGLGVQASWDPGEKQRGFRASVTSSWGQDGGGQTTLWDNADAVTRPAGMGAMGLSSPYRMESEVAYGGLTVPGVPGLLTPYGRLRWARNGWELALGTAWSLPPRSQVALPLMLELEAMRRENRTGPADRAVLLRMSISF